jgi:hypothetical protein
MMPRCTFVSVVLVVLIAVLPSDSPVFGVSEDVPVPPGEEK